MQDTTLPSPVGVIAHKEAAVTNGHGHGDPYWKKMLRRTALVLFLLNVAAIFVPALLNYIYTDQGFHSPSLYLMWPSIIGWALIAAIMARSNIL